MLSKTESILPSENTDYENHMYLMHLFDNHNPKNLDYKDFFEDYEKNCCLIGSDFHSKQVRDYADKVYSKKGILEAHKKLAYIISPVPTLYSFEIYGKDNITKAFHHDMEFLNKLSSQTSNEFWKLYKEAISEDENLYHFNRYYDQFMNGEYQFEEEFYAEYCQNFDMSDIRKTIDKYHSLFPNEEFNMNNISKPEFKDKFSYIERYILNKKVFEQNSKEPIKSQNTIEVHKSKIPEDLAEYFMTKWDMFQDKEKNRLYINNYHGSYDKFELKAENGTNWHKYLNSHLYYRDNKNNLSIPLKISSDILDKQMIKYIDEFKSPEYDKVGFKNGILDISSNIYSFYTQIESEPVYTKISLPHKYNPNANGGELRKWLYSNFSIEEVQGLLEYIGCTIIETGHLKHQWLLMMVGLSNAGKSMLAGFIRKALGDSNVVSLNLEKIIKGNSFESSQIIDKQLAIIEEMDNNQIDSYAWFKEFTSGSPIPVEEKNKPQINVRPEDVPHLIIIGNSPTQLENMDEAMLRRILLLEFKKRPSKNQLKDELFRFRIENNEDCMEWLLFHSIHSYREMVLKKSSPVLKYEDEELAEKLEKHEKSEKFLIQNYFTVVDNPYQEENKLTKILFFKLVTILSELPENGLNIKNSNSRVWKYAIKELTGNRDNFKRIRRTINGNQYDCWIDMAPKDEIYEKYCSKCPICGEWTIKGEPCIYKCED